MRGKVGHPPQSEMELGKARGKSSESPAAKRNRRSAVSTVSTLFLIGCGWRLLARPPARFFALGRTRDCFAIPRRA
jgi:hypothetical protein